MSDKIRILLTNDDGICAPGIAALEEVIQDYGQVWVVAPDSERSTSSHSMTLRMPLLMEQTGERKYAVQGVPSDCVYIALHHILPAYPDIVISGINAGANMGKDVYYSGTVGAAREAAFHGIRALAASLVEGSDFRMAAGVVRNVAERIIERGSEKDFPLLYNLNIPPRSPLGTRVGVLGNRKYPKHVEKRTIPVSQESYYWLGGPPIEDRLIEGSDGWLVRNGYASLTPLSLDQTLSKGLEMTRLIFSGMEDGNE